MIPVRIPLTPKVFSLQFVFEKNENKQKEAALGQFFLKKQREEYFFAERLVLNKRSCHFSSFPAMILFVNETVKF